MRLWTRAILVGALAASTGALGCAEEREPINRSQPNALAKSFFVGDLQDDADNPEFWTQGTVIDVGYGAAQDGLFTSTYAQPVARIKWQILEDLLIGRLAYERIDGSDGKKGLGKSNGINEGQIAYIYPITSHFDIRRDYNPSTGEESNVIVENTTDRPWNERDYMRVDWSRNLNTDAFDYDTLSLMGIYGGVSYEPVSYYVNDPKHQDAPVFDVESGYFDVTNKALATPGLVDLSHLGWGIDSFPACYLDADVFSGTAPSGNCNPVEITLRQSFRKVIDEDYEPEDWDGYRFQAYGAFTADRTGYARNYGMVDEKQHRFIARYNVWERSHYYKDPEKMTGAIECNTPDTTPFEADPHRDLDATDINGDTIPDGNGTEDECEAVTLALKDDDHPNGIPGSRCDEFTQKCTLPYQARKVRPVIWHYTKNSAQDFFEGTLWATNEWDVAFRVASQTAKYSECAKTKVFTDKTGGRVLNEQGQEVDGPDGYDDLRDTNRDGMDDACAAAYPVYNGQQDENEDAIALTTEVNLCRSSFNPAVLSEDELAAKDEKCQDVADSIGAKRGYSAGVIAIAKMQPAVVLCHGPVEANDPLACGTAEQRLPANITAAMCDAEWNSDSPDAEIVAACEKAHTVRIGDLRYHQVNTIKTPQTPSPWGIMTDSVDPTNGYKIAASINIWSHVNDLWSQGVTDTVRYIQGDLTAPEITDGQYVSDWAAASEAAGKKGAAPMLTRDQVDERIMQVAWQASRGAERAVGPLAEAMPSKETLLDQLRNPRLTDTRNQPELRAKIRQITNQVRSMRSSPSVTSEDRQYTEARRKNALDTPTEAAVMTTAMRQMAGVSEEAGLTASDTAKFTSILRGLNPTMREEFRRAKENALAARGACIMQEAPTPNSLTSLANVLGAKFGDWTTKFDPNDTNGRHAHFDRMRLYLAQRAQYAVIIHEMGHSVGLRHNFVSSSNAYNYRPQYWQLRTKNGTVGDGYDSTGRPILDENNQPVGDSGFCTDLSDGSCVGPRYYDPPTSEESSQLIHMFMASSVMDYAGEMTQDLIGLGAYDFAATRSFYGDTLSVYSDPSYNINAPRGRTNLRTITDNFGGITGYSYEEPTLGNADDAESIPMHYSKLQDRFELIKDCSDIPNVNDFKPSNWDVAKQGEWHPVLDGGLVSVSTNAEGAPVYSRCKTQKVDYVQHGRMRQAVRGAEIQSFTSTSRVIDPAGRTRTPTAFASDNWADLGNLAVYRHDNGADAYELFNFLITEQETRHIFDNYRRNRLSFSVRGAANRILDRYNSKMRDGAKGLGLYFNLLRDLYNVGDYEEVLFNIHEGFGGGLKDNLLASSIAFDHFTHQLQRPQSGPHRRVGAVLSSSDLSVNNGYPVAVNIPDGSVGKFDYVSYGGKLIENQLSDDNGDYDSNYTMNAGSYYDKVYVPYLLSESVDNFISSSPDDFLDARYRSVSMTDMFPVGFRRMLGSMLTYDEAIKGPALMAAESGAPLVEFQSKLPSQPLGWTSFWTAKPELCFPGQTGFNCSTPYTDRNFGGQTAGGEDSEITNIIHVSSNVDWEQWKFLIIQTMLYLPENAKNTWINDMGVWEIGADDDPGFANRIEVHTPSGRTFVASTGGQEVINGRVVQKGIAARMAQQANDLLQTLFSTYEVHGPGVDCGEEVCTISPTGDYLLADILVEPELDLDGNVTNDTTYWIVPVGQPNQSAPNFTRYNDYEPLFSFVRQTMQDFRMAHPTMKGIYD